MHKLAIIFLLFFISTSAVQAQLTEFRAGDKLSASEMNKNFQYLEGQFRGARKTTVNCGTSGNGSGINEAIENGYTDITITGICKENIRATVWRESTADNNQPSGKLAPRYLKITGANSSAKIVDATSNTETLIFVTSGATLSLKNLTLSGGQQGVVAARNSNLYLSNVRVENFTDNGIVVADSSWLGVDEGGVVVEGNDTGFGVYLINGASGWMYKSNISNVERGIVVYGGSFFYIRDTDISDTKIGIRVDASKLIKYEGTADINNASECGIKVTANSLFKNSSGKLTIKNIESSNPLCFEVSDSYLNDVTATGDSVFSNSRSYITNSTFNGSIELRSGTNVLMYTSNLVSLEKVGMRIYDNSGLRIEDSIISTTIDSIYINPKGSLTGRNVEISSNLGLAVYLDQNSNIWLTDSVLRSNGKSALVLRGNSSSELSNTTVSRVDEGFEIDLSTLSFLRVSGTTSIDEIGCTNSAVVEISGEAKVSNLGSDCSD